MPEENDAAPGFEPQPPGRRNSMQRSLLLSLAIMMIAFFLASRAGRLWRSGSGTTREFQVMNTFGSITVPNGGSSNLSPEELAELAENAVREVDRLMSPFGQDSDVRRLNETPAGVWVEVDPHTWKVVMEALRWNRLSGGAFDPTIGPIKRLFVFDQSETDTWPSDEAMAEAKSRVGAEKLLFDREGMRLSWKADGMRLDLGAIAKGYGADLAAEVLLKEGVINALVNIGGELRVLGSKPDNPPKPWKMGIRNPRSDDFVESVEIVPWVGTDKPADIGVATSGDYERFLIYKGKRYEHIIDPRNGEPLQEGVASVTVMYPGSCLAADALATTLCVLGPDEAKDFLQQQTLGLFSKGVRVTMLMPVNGGKLRRLDFRIDDKGGFYEAESEIAAQ